MGKAYVFRRRSGGSSWPHPENGHVGWAFQLADGTFLCGATENPSGKDGGVGIGKGAWMERRHEHELLQVFGSPRGFPTGTAPAYDHCKVLTCAGGNPAAAHGKAVWCSQQPFQGLGLPFQRGRNCLDDVFDIVTAYGHPNLPWPTDPRYWKPNDWFNTLVEGQISIPRLMVSLEDLALPDVDPAEVRAPTWPEMA